MDEQLPLEHQGLDGAFAREKIMRLFQFVAEYHQMRNPAVRQVSSYEWILRLADIPDHPCIEIRRRVAEPNEQEEEAGSTEPAERLLLCVRRPSLTEPPAAPPVLDGWLGRDWRDCQANPEVVVSRNRTDDNGATVVEMFDADGTRVGALVGYRMLWDNWAAAERLTLAAGAVFESLYDLQGRLRRDGERYELVVADGLLSWARDDGGIRHPVLFRTLRLDFDATIPEFRIVETSPVTEFYTALFRGMTDVGGDVVGALRTDVEELNPHPLGETGTDAFLRSLASSLSPRGTFSGGTATGTEREDPVTSRAPVFIMRQRTMGLVRAFDAIVKDIIGGGELSRALLNIVGSAEQGIEVPGLAASGDPQSSGGGVLEPDLLDEQILFTREANAEQIEIARRLAHEWCIAVQGPPGTGKSHTIANLIGHLLASGKRVLVTSHTTKALRVLRSKVVDELQPLCLSVLDSAEDDAALKSTIDGIVQRLGSVDARALDRDIAEFTAERQALIQEMRSLNAALRDARLGEQRPIVLEGTSIQPIAAAKQVAEGQGIHDWIPSPVSLADPLPLTLSELSELYATNAALPAEDEQTLQDPLPNLSNLPAPAAFSDIVRERRELAKLDIAYRSDLWESVPSVTEPDALDAVVLQLKDAFEMLERFEPWALRVAEAGTTESDRAQWETLLAEITALRQEAASGRELFLAYAPRLASDIPPDRARELYETIAAEVRTTGKAPGALTLLVRPEWKRAIEGAKVADGSRVRLPEHFEALASHARLVHKRDAFRRRWRLQVEAIGGPAAESLGEEIEGNADRMTTLIAGALGWWQTSLTPAVTRAKQVGFRWSTAQAECDARFASMDRVARVRRLADDLVPAAFAIERARRASRHIDAKIGDLRSLALTWPPSAPGNALRRAVDSLSPEAFQSAYDEIERLSVQTGRARTRGDLLRRLERAAPNWADQIRGRHGIHGRATLPGDVAAAWRWRQLEDELTRRDEVSMPELLRTLDDRRSALHNTTSLLADRSAWRWQAARTTHTQRQSLMGFATAKKRLGKGTGKRAASFAALARQLMTDAREAVPVWIMPIIKAAEVFDPAQPRFDVVIIDEASQCDLTGLLTFYLGKQVIVVGDDEQVSPSAVGEAVVNVEHLIDEYLQDVPLNKLFDGKLSLYDIAKQSFSSGSLRLLEHFRCVPDIIRFSNSLSYEGAIKPLREVDPNDPAPAVVAHRVASSGTAGKVNEDEAVVVAALAAAAIEQPEYAGKSFGVISMVGDEQAYRIETLIRMVVSPAISEARSLLAGSAAQFQGDERDVMFLSMVDVGEGVPLPLNRQTKTFQQRFNVAASRARDQMWVVYSLDPETELKSDDIRRRLIAHALDPSALAKAEAIGLARAESPFEREVIQRISRAGYRLKTQHAVGAYRIDIVVEGVRERLAVECDGDRYHRPEDLQKDIERQQILERLNWKFVRIRGSRFYRDRDAAMRPVFERLAELDIHPLEPSDSTLPIVDDEVLVKRVRARAAEIQEEIRERIAAAPRSARRGRPRSLFGLVEGPDWL